MLGVWEAEDAGAFPAPNPAPASAGAEGGVYTPQTLELCSLNEDA